MKPVWLKYVGGVTFKEHEIPGEVRLPLPDGAYLDLRWDSYMKAWTVRGGGGRALTGLLSVQPSAGNVVSIKVVD